MADAGMRWAGTDRPFRWAFSILDHATGYMIAAAAIRGLTRRTTNGEGSLSRLALARTAGLIARARAEAANALLLDNGDIIQGWRDKQGSEIRYIQGPDYLERVESPNSGEILRYAAHRAGDYWLLDREDMLIEGQKYTSHYTFDANNRILQQTVDYQNASGCNHIISMVADYTYQNDALAGLNFRCELHAPTCGESIAGVGPIKQLKSVVQAKNRIETPLRNPTPAGLDVPARS